MADKGDEVRKRRQAGERRTLVFRWGRRIESGQFRQRWTWTDFAIPWLIGLVTGLAVGMKL